METSTLLWTLVAVAFVLAAIGLVSWHALSGFVQVVLAAAIVLFVIRVVRRRRSRPISRRSGII
jgi:hypothetical protein